MKNIWLRLEKWLEINYYLNLSIADIYSSWQNQTGSDICIFCRNYVYKYNVINSNNIAQLILFEFQGVCNYFSTWYTPQDFFLSNFRSIFSFMSERFNVTNNTSAFVWLPLTQFYCSIEDSRIYLFFLPISRICQITEIVTKIIS